jgi:hypothetical protein
MTAAALALLTTTTAHADDVCSSDRLEAALSTLEAAMDKVAAFYNKAGPAKFCAINKPVIDKAITGVTGIQ